MKIQHST